MTTTLTKREAKKALGAFYTPPPMAAALVDWAVRSPNDRVFDPSFGGSVFIEAALQRLSLLGAKPETSQAQVFGADVDDEAFLRPSVGTERANLHRGDFFGMRPDEEIPRVEAVVGNPPYIRYQEFNGAAEVAHRLAAEAGVPLTRLASSWAPFLIHGTSFVKDGGRMAQVLPAELIHAQYAAGITRFLAANFKRVAIVVFDQRVFPDALEEIVLLFAEERKIDAQGSVDLVSFSSLAELDTSKLFPDTPSGSRVPGKLLGRLLPTATRALLAELSDRSETTELGDVAAVDIGAVTGANDFFLLSRTEARDMPRRIVRPAISKAAQVAGARISAADHRRLLDEGRKGLMFVVDASTEPRSSAVQQRIAVGEEAGVQDGYKCRVRKPWWSVPIPKRGVADFLLTYFASEHPRLVLNEAGVLQTNTIHGVYLKTPMEPAALAVAFYNSLTLLSAELVGRSYGGGVLKLEPTEAGSLILPPVPETLGDLLDEVDALIRDRKLEAALDLVDPIVLGGGLGLSSQEIRALRDGGAQLRARRRARGARPAPAAG